MRIREWRSIGYIRFGKEIHRMWQWKDSNWYVTIPADDASETITILGGIGYNGTIQQHAEEMRTPR